MHLIFMGSVVLLIWKSQRNDGGTMNHFLFKAGLILLGSVWAASAQAAVDSYRFIHVTIATPWYIFIFLLMGVFAPFVLMAVIAWRNAARKSEQDAEDTNHEPVK
jgi:uncharacterized oligopeptide transporter (OPT) family protein